MTVTPFARAVETYDLDPLFYDTDGGGVAVRDELLQCVTVDTSSLESTLTFTVSTSVTSAGGKPITEEMVVRFKNRTYKVRTIEEHRDINGGKDTTTAYCERLWYDLLYVKEIPATDLVNVYANNVLDNLLKNTGWTVGQVDSSQGISFSLTEGTLLQALKDVAAAYGLWLVPDDQTKQIHLLKENTTGRDRGVYFDYERGISQATRRSDTSTLVTRIYGRNEDGQTIAPANQGVPYIEDFTWTNDIRVLTYNFRSGISPATMLRYLRGYLATRSRPVVTYEYTLRGLLGRVNEVDRFEVFDRVFVLDTDFTEPVKSMVTEFRVDWLDLRNSTITLGSPRPTLASGTGGGSGLGSEGPNSESRFVQRKNLGEVVIPESTTPTQVLLVDFATSSEATLQVGLSLRVNITANVGVVPRLSGYFLLDGDRMSEEIEYTATKSGWFTVGIPALVEGLPTGQHTISLWLRMSPGSAVVPVTGAALWVSSTGVVGGGSTNPDRGVLDAVEPWLVFTPTDSATVAFETVIRGEPSDTVPGWLGFTVDDVGALVEFNPIISVSGSVVTITGVLPFQQVRLRITDTPSGAVEGLFDADAFGVWTGDLGSLFMLPAGTWSGLEVKFKQSFSITVT